MRDPENIKQLSTLEIDYIGFIFHPSSPRYFLSFDNEESVNRLNGLLDRFKRVGVVVNENIETVLSYIEKYSLDCIQLHGSEDYQYCVQIKQHYPNIEIIKAISISEEKDLLQTENYLEDNTICNYFLFDTKTTRYGGSGKKFDWEILDVYSGSIPFLLSGGISASDATEIKNINHPKFAGVDLNSRFETEPGLKDIELVRTFINELKS